MCELHYLPLSWEIFCCCFLYFCRFSAKSKVTTQCHISVYNWSRGFPEYTESRQSCSAHVPLLRMSTTGSHQQISSPRALPAATDAIDAMPPSPDRIFRLHLEISATARAATFDYAPAKISFWIQPNFKLRERNFTYPGNRNRLMFWEYISFEA